MAFCSECGNDIETDKFCSKCGKSSDGINPDIKKEDRDITEAVIHLKALSNLSSSVILPDDIKMYEEALFKINDEKFRSFSASLKVDKRVTEINRLLEIDQKVTRKMLGRDSTQSAITEVEKKEQTKSPTNKVSKSDRFIAFTLFSVLILLVFYISIRMTNNTEQGMQTDSPPKVVFGNKSDVFYDIPIDKEGRYVFKNWQEYYEKGFKKENIIDTAFIDISGKKNTLNNVYEIKSPKTKKILYFRVSNDINRPFPQSLKPRFLKSQNDDACDCLKSFVENNSSKQLSCVNEYYDSAFDYVEINYPNDRFQNQEAVLQRYFYDKCSI